MLQVAQHALSPLHVQNQLLTPSRGFLVTCGVALALLWNIFGMVVVSYYFSFMAALLWLEFEMSLQFAWL